MSSLTERAAEGAAQQQEKDAQMRAKLKFNTVLAAGFALAAFSAVSAPAALATEGPFYKVAGARLAAGESKALKVKTLEKYTLEAKSQGQAIECGKATAAAGAKIVGSTGATSATSELTLEFSGCTTHSNGTKCVIENGTITTSLLKGVLGYATETRSGKLYEALKPASGTGFAKVNYVAEEGGTCIFGPLELEGILVATVRTGKATVEVGINEKQAKTAEMQFEFTAPKTVWTETAGTIAKVKAGVTFLGATMIANGDSALELEGLPEWGVFTK